MTDHDARSTAPDAIGVAVQAVRQPDAAAGAALAGIVTAIDASVGALYVVGEAGVAGTSRVEFVAGAGPGALALGRLGAVESTSAKVLTGLATSSVVVDRIEPTGLPEPFQLSSVLRLSGPLPESGGFLVLLAGSAPLQLEVLEQHAALAVPVIALAALDVRVARLKARVRELRQSRVAAIATLRHDAAAPLTSIQGAVEAVLEAEVDDGARERLLALIRRQAERLSSMISDPWEVDEAGPSRLVAVDLAAVVDRAVAAGVLGRTYEVEQQVASRRLVTDPERLERAIVNLLDNARKYAPPGEAVRVVSQEVEGGVEVAVCDRGPGVDADLLPSLFTSFARDHSRPDSQGIGLKSVAAIAGQLGGRITYSRHSGWSRFQLFLPDLGGPVGAVVPDGGSGPSS